jgi:putative sigma-54 modulation protein
MNLQITGHHVTVTPAIKEYVESKMQRITRHFDHVIDSQVVLSIEPLKHRAEVTLHIPGKDIHCESTQENLYAAIDMLLDKVDRKVIQHKDRTQSRAHMSPKRAILAEI